MVHGTTSNPNKNIIIKDDNNNNNNDSDNINNINKTKIDERNDELSYVF